MRIGIFMAYMPDVKLGSEGLGRYIGNLIKGFIDDNNDVVIACPKWMVDPLLELFRDFNILENKVELLTTFRVPVLWKWYEACLDRKPKGQSGIKTLTLKNYSNLMDFVIDKVMSIGSALLLAMAVFATGVVGIALLPLELLAAIVYFLCRLLIWAIHKGKESLKLNFFKMSDIHRVYSKTKDSIQEHAYKQLYAKTVEELIRKVNRDGGDVWFVPTLFWPEATGIKGVTVFTAPDLVSVEFPFQFAEAPGSVISTDTCAKTVKKAKYFITYSDYIKYDVLVKQFCKPADHIVAIPHINNSSLSYVDVIESNAEYQTRTQRTLTDEFCRELLYRLPQYSTQREFLRGFDFDNVEYIFYASQLRPHKNILNLIRAYEFLLRTRGIHFKLFLTCDLDASAEVRDYIVQHGLAHDVIAFKRIPVQLLSALYHCAALAVNPTLYEGGFLTFTIGEAMSVGTPVIMSRIPQVTDMIPDRYPLEDILFDPHDYMDMAEKIIYGVNNADKLYQEELEMYGDIERRTGQAVSGEYVRAFERFIKMDEESAEEKNEDRPEIERDGSALVSAHM